MRRIALILVMIASVWGMTAAQDGDGQLCVRSFEDRNASGKLDAGEPLLTRGVNVNLLDAGGVTIASALLDNSPTAAQGVVCFQFLSAGQYSVVITSADYTPPDPIITTVASGGLPTVIEFGGQRAGAQAVATSQPTPQVSSEDQTARILVSVLATVVVVLGMAVLGVFVYLIAFRRSKPPVTTMDMRRVTSTGSMPAVRTGDTGRTPKV
jgi:hypothetical protein